jgi:hypothetical protein
MIREISKYIYKSIFNKDFNRLTIDAKDDYDVISEAIISQVPIKCPVYQCGGFMIAKDRKRPKDFIESEHYDGDEQTPDLICVNCKARYKFDGFRNKKSLTNAQFMSQILKQDVYCENGELRHLVDDKIIKRYIRRLEV